MGNYLISGASSGLGEEVARHLMSQGHTVYLLGRNEQKLKELSGEFGQCGVPLSVNLEKSSEIEELFDGLDVQFDGMVYCAGQNEGFLIQMNDISVARRVMEVNCLAFMELGKYFCKKKYSREGASVVAISSMSAVKNPAGMSIYSSSKAALNSVVQTMAREYVKRKIRVNAIMPGYLEKHMKDEIIPWKVSDKDGSKLKEIQPYGTIPYGQVCELIEFLLSDKSLYVTGSTIEISGGQ